MADKSAESAENAEIMDTIASTDSNEGSKEIEEAPKGTENDRDQMETESNEQSATDESTLITVVIKTPQDEKTISVGCSASVKKLKQVASSKFQSSADLLCLIYTGKILQDDEMLDASGIGDGAMVHMVVKTAPSQPETQATSASSQESEVDSDANTWQGPLQFAGVGLESMSYAQLQQHIQRQMMNKPELIRQMVQNPLVQQLMSNPSVITELISSNKQSKDWLQRNPELAEMLNNQEIMQQTLEIAQNPEMMNEMISAQNRGRLQFGLGSTGRHQKLAAPSFPDLQTSWQQMAKNPQILQQMMNMPYMKTMLEGFAADPQLAYKMMSGHPMFAGSPAVQQQMQHLMPQYVHQLQDPATQSLVTNPNALQALLKIQQGVDMLQSEAPGLVNSSGLPYLSVPPPLATFSPTSDTAANQSVNSADVMASVMTQLVSQLASGTINKLPEEKFKEQIDELSAMGFTDRSANLQALIGTLGDLGAAVERLNQQRTV